MYTNKHIWHCSCGSLALALKSSKNTKNNINISQPFIYICPTFTRTASISEPQTRLVFTKETQSKENNPFTTKSFRHSLFLFSKYDCFVLAFSLFK